FLKGIHQVQKQKPAQPFTYCDDNGCTWSVSFSKATRTDVKEPQCLFLIDQVVSSDENSFQCSRKLNIERDPYLIEHLVRGKPALPGTFMIEMVAQAFRAARPNLRIDEFSDIQFLRFMRPSLDVRIEAKRLAGSSDIQDYEVFLISDKFSPKGFLLQKDIKHFSCRVKLTQGKYSQNGPSGPKIQGIGTVMVDPYHVPGSDVYLSGVFKTISEMKMSSEYKWGNFDLNLSSVPAQFANGVMSPLLLDGAFRLGALTGDPDQPIPFPVSIQSMKVHSVMTDLELLKSGGALAVFEKRSNRILVVSGNRLLYELAGFVGQSTDGQVSKSPDMPSVSVIKKNKANAALAPFPSQSMGRFVSIYKPKPLIQVVSAAPEKPFLIIVDSAMGQQEIQKTSLAKLPHRSMNFKEASLLKTETLSQFSEVILLVDLPMIQTASNLDERKQVMETLKFYHQLCQVLAGNEQIKICACIGNAWQGSDIHPFLGMLRGFFRSLYQEMSGERVRMVLIDQPWLSLTDEIGREANLISDEYEVFYRQRERFVKGLQPHTSFPQESQFSVADNSVVLFTGGGRGVGGYLSVQWARLYPNNRIAILGRSPRGRALGLQKEVVAEFGEMKLETFIKFKMKSKDGPTPIPKIVAEFHQLSGELELEECLKKLDDLGVQYEYYMCDVKNAAQVQTTLQKVYSRFHTVNFVIHSAGVDSSKKIQAKTWSEFESNFNVKVEGFFNLLSGIKLDEIKQWINFGSLVSYHGNSGQTDYGAANDALNTVSTYLNALSPHVRFCTLNWGSWNEVGMVVRSKAMKELMETKHWKLLDPAEAAIGFFRELNYGTKSDSQVFIFEEGDRNGFKPFILKQGGKVG
ncbi:MAG: SDR family NAD(P)-dependent oxidoreductase, partial [Pseudobdellovibrionaceae bacterium]